MSYDQIPKQEIRALRRAARWKKKEIMCRQMFFSAVALLIALSVAETLSSAFNLPSLAKYAIVGFIFAGLYAVFQEAAVEPLMRREVERLKNA